MHAVKRNGYVIEGITNEQKIGRVKERRSERERRRGNDNPSTAACIAKCDPIKLININAFIYAHITIKRRRRREKKR